MPVKPTKKRDLYKGRVLNARPDTIDFRDKIYSASLIEVPAVKPLKEYKKLKVPVLDQGKEGACTGFGLATMIHFLKIKYNPDHLNSKVSPRMLYEMAKKYDEWQGEDYTGSSARGAMKGWHKHGVCADSVWLYDPDLPDKEFNQTRAEDAAKTPLGAYYRVNHKDIVDMHCALIEVGILYVTARVHDGWFSLTPDAQIPYEGQIVSGGHAFAIVAYDEHGFWIQNSWGEKWGEKGFAMLSYDDWLANGTDAWVARLGAPVRLSSPNSVAKSFSLSSSGKDVNSFLELRKHVISLGNDGKLQIKGTYGNKLEDVARIFEENIPEVTKGWTNRRIMFYAHGGLVPENSVLQMLSDWKQTLIANEIYPVFFIWHSDLGSTLRYIMEDGIMKIKPEERVSSALDFMLDRFDDFLEPVLRYPGRTIWNEMKENAIRASKDGNGADLILQQLRKYLAGGSSASIHIVAHSAGSIFMAPFIKKIGKEESITIRTCTLWAPACSMADFDHYYYPQLKNKKIKNFNLFTLTEQAEQDDNCFRIYNKSLLHLVSNSFEQIARGTPLLGMSKYIDQHRSLKKLINDKTIEHITSPNSLPSPDACEASHHGEFNDNEKCLNSTIARITRSDISTLFGDSAGPSEEMPTDAIEAGTRAGETYKPENIEKEKAAPSPEKPQLNRRPSEDQFKQRRESINKLFKSHNFQD